MNTEKVMEALRRVEWFGRGLSTDPCPWCRYQRGGALAYHRRRYGEGYADDCKLAALLSEGEKKSRGKMEARQLIEHGFAHPEYGLVGWRECYVCKQPYPEWAISSISCCPSRKVLKYKSHRDDCKLAAPLDALGIEVLASTMENQGSSVKEVTITFS